MGYIYCFKNLINGKCYIGQTIRNPQVRYSQHLATHDETVFHNALKKYGKENFLFYVIGEFPDNELNEKERYYIKRFNSHWQDGHGYNMSYGGENSPDVTYRKVRAYPLDNKYMPIIDESQSFKSLTEATNILTKKIGNKFAIPNLIAICQGKRYSVFGYTFCYIDENGEDIPTGYTGHIDYHEASKENVKKAQKANSIPVTMIAPWGEEFYYDSIKQAGRDLHIDPKTIKKIIETKKEISAGPNRGWRAELYRGEEKE